MDFKHSDKALHFQERVNRFIAERIQPRAADYWAKVHADHTVQPKTMEALKAEAVAATMPPGRRERHVPTSLFRNLLRETGSPRFEDVTRAAGLVRAGNAADAKLGGVGDTADDPTSDRASAPTSAPTSISTSKDAQP